MRYRRGAGPGFTFQVLTPVHIDLRFVPGFPLQSLTLLKDAVFNNQQQFSNYWISKVAKKVNLINVTENDIN